MLHYQPDTIRKPTGIMRNLSWQQKNITFFYLHSNSFAVFLYLNFNISLQLVKKLLSFIIVVIFSRVRSSHYHYNKIGVFINYLVIYRWFKQVTVFVDPFPEI